MQIGVSKHDKPPGCFGEEMYLCDEKENKCNSLRLFRSCVALKKQTDVPPKTLWRFL